jgi:hypothetical protein
MVAEYETNGCHTLAGMVISTFAKSINPGSSTAYAYHYTKFNICVHSSYLDKMYIFLRLLKFCFFIIAQNCKLLYDVTYIGLKIVLKSLYRNHSRVPEKREYIYNQSITTSRKEK